MDIEILFKRRCLVSLSFSDGSEIQCITTLNPTILESLNLSEVDNFVDLTCMKKIPNELLVADNIKVTISPTTKITLSELDLLFQDSIKNHWENAR